MRLEEVRFGIRVKFIGAQETHLLQPNEVLTVNGIFASGVKVIDMHGTGWSLKPEELEPIEPINKGRLLTFQELMAFAEKGFDAQDIIELRKEGIF